MSRWAFSLGAALLTAGAFSCFGDIIIEEERPPEQMETGSSDLNPSGSACNVGDVRCEGQWLEVCDAVTATASPEWSKRQDCLSAALCVADPGNCETPVCRVGEPRCSGATPETCNGNLNGFEALGACVNAAHCSLDDAKCVAEGKTTPCCLDVPCEPGELRCNGSEMQRCRDDQTDLDAVASCDTLELCQLSQPDCSATQTTCACQPAVCDAGATRCTGLTLERCNVGRTAWEPVQDCVTVELCELGRERVPLACEPVVCVPGEYNCDGETLERCNPGQSDFDNGVPCVGGPGFCNETLGICSQCEVGDTRCDGAQIQACRADRSTFDPVPGSVCATPQLCGRDPSGAAVCTPPVCDVDEFDCEGAQLLRCNEGRTDFEPFGDPCRRADLCSDVRDRCDFCVPNRRECNGDRTTTRVCAPDGNRFDEVTNCPLGCIPETGACRTCTVGTYTCTSGQLSRCNDGFSFTALNRAADCNGATQVTCSGNTVQNNPCGTIGCNTIRNACNQCNPAVATSCTPGLLCNTSGLCRCTPNAFGCNADALLRCNGTGTATASGPRCSTGNDNNVLRTCDAGALTENTCGSGALCTASPGETCAVCVPGTLSCSSGALAVCNGAGSGFGPASACQGAILRSCNGTTLAAPRDCGSSALCLASSGGICAQCLPTEEPSCNAEGLEIRCVAGRFITSECLGGTSCVEGDGCVVPAVPAVAPAGVE